MSESPSLLATPAAVSLLDAVTVLGAASDPVRYELLRVLADGKARSIGQLSAAVKRSRDSVSKHLVVLCDARLISAATLAGSDGRKQHHVVPEIFRSRDAAGKTVLDFGAVVPRLD
jgi:DNA-binding transcriptional ArsR family regulator